MERETREEMLRCEWASLPQELLEIIAHKLSSRFDVFRFRAVCSSWRSALSPSHLTFHLSPLFSHISRSQSASFFTPFSICCLQLSTTPSVPRQMKTLWDEGSSTWVDNGQGGPTNTNTSFLVKVVELESGEVKLLDPLSSSSKILQLAVSPNTSKTFNLLNFRLIELYKGYHLGFKVKDRFQKKLFSDDCTAVGISFDGKMGFRRLNNVWTNLGSEETHYDDTILYKGQFYVIDSLGIVSWINQSMNLIQYTPPLCGCGQLKNLIESDEKLYAIDCYIDLERWLMPQWRDEEMFRVDRDCARVDMRVYVLDEEWGAWVPIESLGNRVFVLGKEYSFSIDVSDFPDCEGNQIYFMEPIARDMKVDWKRDCYVLWVFSLDDRRIHRVCRQPFHSRLFSLSMNWSPDVAL